MCIVRSLEVGVDVDVSCFGSCFSLVTVSIQSVDGAVAALEFWRRMDDMFYRISLIT